MENVEYLQGRFEIESESKRDGIDGWTFQFSSLSGHGICAFLAFLNSLCQVGNRKLSDYVDIKYDGTNYTVTFLKYDPAIWGTTTNSVTVSKSTIDAAQGVRGDIDTIIVANALDQILKINKDKGQTNAWGAQRYGVFARYFLGIAGESEKADAPGYKIKDLTFEQITNLYNNYLAGNIKDLCCLGFSQNLKLGYIYNHDYTLKSIGTDPNGNGYLELINPWDDADCIRCSLEDLKKTNLEIFSHTSTAADFEKYLSSVLS